MTTVRREPPSKTEGGGATGNLSVLRRAQWYDQGIADLAAGKHAVGCECVYGRTVLYADEPPPKKVNGCLTIARALRDFAGYGVEEETT